MTEFMYFSLYTNKCSMHKRHSIATLESNCQLNVKGRFCTLALAHNLFWFCPAEAPPIA